MSRPRTTLDRAWIALGLSLGVAFLAAIPFDLRVSRALFRPDWAPGRWIQAWGTAPTFVLYVLALVWLVLARLRRRSLLLARLASALLTQGLLHTLVLVTLLKLLWGRVRFASLAPDFVDFTPVWLLRPFSGDVSFPSGHVAAALVPVVAVLLLGRAGRRGAATGVGLATLAWGVFVGYARLGFGAHYLTDVLFAAATAVLLAPLSLRLGDAYLRRFDRSP